MNIFFELNFAFEKSCLGILGKDNSIYILYYFLYVAKVIEKVHSDFYGNKFFRAKFPFERPRKGRDNLSQVNIIGAACVQKSIEIITAPH